VREIRQAGRKNPADYLSNKERVKIRDAAYEYGTIPTEDMTEEEIDELKTELAQRFGVKKSELSIDDHRSWKIPSLVEVSLDAGLRPCEVKNATVDWIDRDKRRLLIPHDDSSKNDDNWKVVLTEGTFEKLENWIEEREKKEMYENTDKIWLTNDGNPFSCKALRDKMRRLFEIADISKKGRKVSWYVMRHSAGTYIADSGGLEHATAQHRHNSKDTTKKYIHPPVESRRETLESITG
jgi:site-specific recombinase XerC